MSRANQLFEGYTIEQGQVLPWPGETALVTDQKTQKKALLHLLSHDSFPWVSPSDWRELLQTLKQGLLLSHPNLLPLLEVIQPFPQSLGVISEWPFPPGASAFHLRHALNLRKDRRFEEAETLVFLEALLHALEALQKHGLIHRLLFPEAILLETPEDGGAARLRLGMTGFAALLHPPKWSKMPGPPLWWGYLAPALRQDPTQGDHPTMDIHALGSIVWEMVTGRVPPSLPQEPPKASNHGPEIALSSWFQTFLLRFFSSSQAPFRSLSEIRLALHEKKEPPSSKALLSSRPSLFTVSYEQTDFSPPETPSPSSETESPLSFSSNEPASDVWTQEEIRGTLEQPWGSRYNRRIAIPSMLFEDPSPSRKTRTPPERPRDSASLEENSPSCASLGTWPVSISSGELLVQPWPPKHPLPEPIPQAWEEEAFRQAKILSPRSPSWAARLFRAGLVLALLLFFWRACFS